MVSAPSAATVAVPAQSEGHSLVQTVFTDTFAFPLRKQSQRSSAQCCRDEGDLELLILPPLLSTAGATGPYYHA